MVRNTWNLIFYRSLNYNINNVAEIVNSSHDFNLAFELTCNFKLCFMFSLYYYSVMTFSFASTDIANYSIT